MKYTLGLDLGTTSVGWAVVDTKREHIVDLGVRLFPLAQNPKDGSSLAAPRRVARGARRRLRRRRARLDRVKALFITHNLLTEAAIEKALATPHPSYQYRAKGLDHLLTNEELFIAVYHLAKRRGYKSNRKKLVATAEGDAQQKKERQDVLAGISENEQKLKDSGFRTVGELFYNELKAHEDDVSFGGVRNKPGSYLHSVSREMLVAELSLLLKAQAKYGNRAITDAFVEALLGEDEDGDPIGAFNHQRPFASGNDLKDLIGPCTFEESEQRAAKATFSFQYFDFLQRLNNLAVFNPGEPKATPLTESERTLVTEKALESKSGKITYGQLRTWLSLDPEQRFNITYTLSRKDRETGKTDAELKDAFEKKQKFASFEKLQSLRKAIEGGKESDEAGVALWRDIKDDHALLDDIASIFTWYKTDKDIKQHLAELTRNGAALDLPPSVRDRMLANLSFDKNGHLSLKALRKLIPLLETGLTYVEAVNELAKTDSAYKGKLPERGHKLLPLSKLEHNTLTNPVVRRSISQTIKVINAIIDRYGSPTRVHIELARDLSRDFKERKRIENSQLENRKKNDAAVEKIRELYRISEPRGEDIVKFKLWQEQNNTCLLTGEPIDERRLFEPGYAEVDHIVPFSRSFDDSYNNKMVVLKAANQEKGNRLPYEWFGSDTERWQAFLQRIDSMKTLPPRKKQNLRLKHFDESRLTERALNDTRYVTRFLKNYIEKSLVFADDPAKRRVLAVNGAATSYIRKRWGLNKNREESARHHAQDAAICAVVNDRLVKKISVFSKLHHLRKYHEATAKLADVDATLDDTERAILEDYVARIEQNQKLHFPEPWVGFRNELRARLSDDPASEFTAYKLRGHDEPWLQEKLKPIFVSRMPRRKVTGQVHDETLRSPKRFDPVHGSFKSSVNVPLQSLTIERLEKEGKYLDPNLREALLDKLREHGGDAKKAFTEPFHKTKTDGTPGPLVRSVKLTMDNQKSGVLINDGTALVDRASMVRVDVFAKPNKKGKDEFYFVPIYVHQTKDAALPNHVCTPGKVEQEWTELGETFTFRFSLYPGDLVRAEKDGEVSFGYYIKAGIAAMSFLVRAHDGSAEKNIGIKTLDKFDKYVVDVLGTSHRVKSEPRHTFR